ncbi:MAG: hypothetical protein QXW85_00855 [Candidatus Nitrosocaldus sp.]
MLSKQILAIVVAVLALTLLIIPVDAARRSPPYSNQSLYPNFNNQCQLPSYDIGVPFGGVNGQRCIAIDRSTGKANQKSQVFTTGAYCARDNGCVVEARTNAGFNDNPVPGNSPIVWSSGYPGGLQYRSYIDAKVRFDTMPGGAARYEVTVTLWYTSPGGSIWYKADEYKRTWERANGASNTISINQYVSDSHILPLSVDVSSTVKTSTFARVQVPFGTAGNANVDAYNTGYWSKVNSIEVCLDRCR